MQIKSQEQIKKDIVKDLRRINEEALAKGFDYYVRDGWFTLTDKKQSISGISIENFKNGEEFGVFFARQVERKLLDLIRKEEEQKIGEKPQEEIPDRGLPDTSE